MTRLLRNLRRTSRLPKVRRKSLKKRKRHQLTRHLCLLLIRNRRRRLRKRKPKLSKLLIRPLLPRKFL